MSPCLHPMRLHVPASALPLPPFAISRAPICAPLHAATRVSPSPSQPRAALDRRGSSRVIAVDEPVSSVCSRAVVPPWTLGSSGGPSSSPSCIATASAQQLAGVALCKHA